jgi:hypothetical protein
LFLWFIVVLLFVLVNLWFLFWSKLSHEPRA